MYREQPGYPAARRPSARNVPSARNADTVPSAAPAIRCWAGPAAEPRAPRGHGSSVSSAACTLRSAARTRRRRSPSRRHRPRARPVTRSRPRRRGRTAGERGRRPRPRCPARAPRPTPPGSTPRSAWTSLVLEAGGHLELDEHRVRRQHPDVGRARDLAPDDGQVQRGGIDGLGLIVSVFGMVSSWSARDARSTDRRKRDEAIESLDVDVVGGLA